MNSAYDTPKASKRLEEIARDRGSDNRLIGIQLANYLEDGIRDSMEMTILPGTKAWRIVNIANQENGEEDIQETVWHLQGVIRAMDLPPFYYKGRSQTLRDRARFLRQAIVLDGLETATFKTAMENLKILHGGFARCVASNALQPLSILVEDPGNITFETSNRYFTSRKEDPTQPSIPFAPTIDPTGALQQCVGTQYFHGEDNQVAYMERSFNKNLSKWITKPVSPVRFRIGDLVEVQVTFMLVPLRDGEWKMASVMRCVTLLDTSFTQEILSKTAMQNAAVGTSKKTPILKRRVGQDVDDEGEPERKRFEAMKID